MRLIIPHSFIINKDDDYIFPAEEIFYESAMAEEALESIELEDSEPIGVEELKVIPIVRKEFPEIWLWDSIESSNEGFVLNFI